MYCPKCGHANADDAYRCVNCGAALQPPGAAPAAAVPNNLVWAILATIFCCLPTGIVAIVYAAQVNAKAAAGDIAGAREAAGNAAMWSWVSFGLGLGFTLLWLLLSFFGALSGVAIDGM